MAWSYPRGSPVGCSTTHQRGLPVSRYPLYPHVPPSISRQSVRLPLPLASPDVPAFPTMSDGVDLRITVFGICSTFTARCGPRVRQTTQWWSSTPKASTASLPPRPLRLLPAGEAVAGWVYLPLRERTFSRRTDNQGSVDKLQIRALDRVSLRGCEDKEARQLGTLCWRSDFIGAIGEKLRRPASAT
jgi:hypothetical protein